MFYSTRYNQSDTPMIPQRNLPIIAPTIPPSLDYTPASPDYSPASDSEFGPSEDPSSDHIPPLPAISPFLSSNDDTTDSDTPDTPPSPTHDTPFTEITASTPISPIIPRRRVMILSPGQPIPHGRPYRYHLNGPVHMMTARKRVGPLSTHRLAVKHSADHSSSDSSSEASSDFHSDASSDSSPRHSLQIILHQIYRVLLWGHIARDVDVEVDHRDISLRDDAIVRVSDGPHLEQDIDPEIQAEIDEYETKTSVRGPVEVRVERVTHPTMPEDIPEPAQEGAVETMYETLGDLREQGHRMVGVESAVIALTKRIAELERDNMRLRGTMSVESQRVDRLQRGMSRMQRELRQIRRLRFYDRASEPQWTLNLLNENVMNKEGENMEEMEKEEMENRREWMKTEMKNMKWEPWEYVSRRAENKRRMEKVTNGENLGQHRRFRQQPPFKRQNTSGQNVARAYTARNNERRGYAGPLPY
ncbi:hypothetical protein Tco_0072339 [Tanacetum coccineum]